jgi:polysaccharide export outer membrane protein
VYEYAWLSIKKFLTIGLGLGLIITTGCSSTSDYPLVPDDQRNLPQDFNYIIGPGDGMEIFVWGNPELTMSVPVRPDGKITTRLVEDIPASGKTSTQLARDIEVAYSEYVKNPVVSVIVNGFIGIPPQQVRVIGEAMSPLKIPYSKHMTLLDLMIAVGGLTPFANGNKSVLIRDYDGKQKTFSVRLDDLIKDGDITANLSLLPGDIVIIPESWF